MIKKKIIDNLSQHLFWDVDGGKLDFDKDRKFIIHRVLDYGLLTDWKIISDYYGIPAIAKTTLSIKDLDKKSASFIALLSGIPKEKFKCYTSKQSTQKHWNF